VFQNTPVIVEGVVVRDPDIREKIIRLIVRPSTVNGNEVAGSKNIIVSVDRFTKISYGDRIAAEGKLRAPEAFETDSGRTFNYPKFLWAHGVSHELPFAEANVISRGEGNPIVSGLLAVKHVLIRGIERALPEPYAALAEGLLLGEKQSLGDTLTQAFRKAGVVHIIVLSGYNVALVIESVLFVSLYVLPRLLGYAVAAVFVVLFAVMTGGSETTIRATIMALLMMVARVLRRPALALRGLFVAAAVMAVLIRSSCSMTYRFNFLYWRHSG
jgi:competence protein ComEC